MLCSSSASVIEGPTSIEKGKNQTDVAQEVSSAEVLYESFSFALPLHCSLPLYSACVNVNDQESNLMLPGQSLAMGLNSNQFKCFTICNFALLSVQINTLSIGQRNAIFSN